MTCPAPQRGSCHPLERRRPRHPLGLAFGDTQHHAITTLFHALGTPFEEHHKRYTEQWDRTSAHQMLLEKVSSDNGNLYHSSFSLMLAHEDKSYPGALIASLSVGWR
ncbi:MAG: hypothetical protein ACLPTQ_10865 [Terriglobales bacterium]